MSRPPEPSRPGIKPQAIRVGPQKSSSYLSRPGINFELSESALNKPQVVRVGQADDLSESDRDSSAPPPPGRAPSTTTAKTSPRRRARPRAAILGRPAARALALDRFRESPKALRRSPARFRGRPVFARLFFRALSDFTRFPFSRVFRALPDFPISPSCLRGRNLSAAGRSVLAAPRSGSLFLPHLSSSRPRLPPSSVSPLSAHPPPHRRAIGSALLRAGFDILRDLAVCFQNPTADQRFNSID